MVRYPHTATVSVKTGVITGGELASTTTTTSTILGRLEFPAHNSPPRQVKSADGNWVEAKGRFFTSAEPVANATSITVSGVEYQIIAWVPYQNYSEIWLD